MSSVMKVDNLRMEFGGLVAVKDVSFEIKEGNSWALLVQMDAASLQPSIVEVDN